MGLALRRRRLADTVVGYVRRAASVTECEWLGAVDQATRDLEEAVSGAEMVVLCTPIAQMRKLVEQMLPALEPGAILTDVGSVKESVVRDLEPLAEEAGARFIGSHPIAGAEKTGVTAARADLFSGAVCVVTPTRKSDAVAVRRVEALWKAVGGRVLRFRPEVHDELVSRTSHLPHIVATQLASFVLSPEHSKMQTTLCGNGFRDTTRVASSSPEMWRDIALSNRAQLLRALGDFAETLDQFRRFLERGDAEAISGLFKQAKGRRDRWLRRACPEKRA